jgi:hypothetical protein
MVVRTLLDSSLLCFKKQTKADSSGGSLPSLFQIKILSVKTSISSAPVVFEYVRLMFSERDKDDYGFFLFNREVEGDLDLVIIHRVDTLQVKGGVQ